MKVAKTLKESTRVLSSQGFDKLLSKAVDLGNDYRIFIRVIKDEKGNPSLPIPTDAGRPLDYKVFGPSWVSYPDGGLEILPGDKFKDLTVLRTWSRIAYILFEASFEAAKKRVIRDAENDAKDAGTEVDNAAVQLKLKEVEIMYKGGKIGTEKVNPTYFPIIGSIKTAVVAQAYLLKFDGKKGVDWDNGTVVSFRVSKDKIMEITSGLREDKGFSPDDELIEYSYSYDGADKPSAGRKAKLIPVEDKATRLSALFPEKWDAFKPTIMASLTANEDIVLAKSSAISSTITIDEVVSKIKDYCTKNPAVMASVDVESKDVHRNAEFMLENNLFAKAPKIVAELEKIVAENRTNNPITKDEEETLSEAEAKAIKAAKEVKESGGKMETLESVMNGLDDDSISNDDEISTITDVEVPEL